MFGFNIMTPCTISLFCKKKYTLTWNVLLLKLFQYITQILWPGSYQESFSKKGKGSGRSRFWQFNGSSNGQLSGRSMVLARIKI